jgi:predicted nucleotidyltransferase
LSYINVESSKQEEYMDQKPDRIKQAIETSFVERVKEVFAENLVSIMLYGSYVSGNYVHKVSDINVLIIIDHSDFSQMKQFGIRCRRMLRKYRITPLLLRKQEFINSSDVFPMEYMDVSSRNLLLFGEDVTKELTLTKNNLRHQLEHQMRGDINTLRQLVIASKGRGRLLGRNIKRWYGSFSAVFRGLLRLKGVEDVPTAANEVLKTIESTFSIEMKPFFDMLDYRNGTKMDVDDLTNRMLDTLRRLISIVDSMESTT